MKPLIRKKCLSERGRKFRWLNNFFFFLLFFLPLSSPPSLAASLLSCFLSITQKSTSLLDSRIIPPCKVSTSILGTTHDYALNMVKAIWDTERINLYDTEHWLWREEEKLMKVSQKRLCSIIWPPTAFQQGTGHNEGNQWCQNIKYGVTGRNTGLAQRLCSPTCWDMWLNISNASVFPSVQGRKIMSCFTHLLWIPNEM